MPPALELDGVCVSLGGRDVVREVSLCVDRARVTAVLGRNGGGKTVMAKAAAGLLPLQRGTVRISGRDVTSIAPHRRVGLGLRYLPQVGGVVPELTVPENLRLGGYALRRRPDCPYEEVLAGVLARFPTLADAAPARAAALSTGQQRVLALARTLMSQPHVLVADEPSAGLSQDAIANLTGVLAGLRERGVSILLVEQNLALARAVADDVVVLDRGAVIYHGPASALDEQGLRALLSGRA